MRKIVKLLDNVNNINDFRVVDELAMTRGNATTLYFQLFTEKTCSDGSTSLTRYIPQDAAAIVQVLSDNLSRDYVICRVASSPFAGDKSIWSIQILSSDIIAFDSLMVTVVENGAKTKFLVESDVAVEETGNMSRFI